MSAIDSDWTLPGLWLAVVASGLYHGLSPGMGWPLAVSAGLMEKSSRALCSALGYLAAGHLLAMLATLLPFALLATLVAWQHEIRIAAALLVIGFGCVLFASARHPRVLARIPPAQIGLWSFVVALAHGAGLMLVPVYLGLCGQTAAAAGPHAAGALAGASLGMAFAVAFLHMVAMILGGGAMAWLVYRYLGVAFVSRSWLNLDRVWAASLIVVGVAALGLNAF